MKSDTKSNILDLLRKNGPCKPGDLARELGLTPQVIHWHLRGLKRGLIEQIGKAPHTRYNLVKKQAAPVQLPPAALDIIESEFSYLTPRGELLYGVAAFESWLESKDLTQDTQSLALAYKKLISDIYSKIEPPFSTRARMEAILGKVFLGDVFISDFYALPQFGKTKLGNLIHAAKTSSQKRFAQQISQFVKGQVEGLAKKHKIDSVCYVPHSIPRILQFLPEFKRQLRLHLPQIPVEKLFYGSVPVAQKSLSKLSERIANAEQTMEIPRDTSVFGSVLIIDDAVGSGATLNALAKKLLNRGATKVIGYAVVGSYKGFDVLPQV